MNVLIDTNIILDDILEREPNTETAKKISCLVTDELINGYLTANTLTDIFYIARKKLTVPVARAAIEALLNIFEIVSIDKSDLRGALTIPISDIEDALQAWCAKKSGAEVLITNNIKDFSGIDFPVITPTEFSI